MSKDLKMKKERKSRPGYVQVSRDRLESFLQACGFSKRIVGHEVVYVRFNHHYDSLIIKVWTSLPAQGGDVRGPGQDAIRITAAYEGDVDYRGRNNFGIYKAQRVFRTGSEEAVIDRIYERMREAYLFTNEWLRKNWADLPRKPRRK